jgi:hypothetical protein
MNVQLMMWSIGVVADRKLTDAQVRIAMAIVMHSNLVDRTCTPGNARLMQVTGFTERGIQLAVKALIARGWLQDIPRKGGRGKVNDFILGLGPDTTAKTPNGRAETPNGHDRNPERPRAKPRTAVQSHSIGNSKENKKENQESALSLFDGEDTTLKSSPQPKPSAKATEKFIDDAFERFYAAYPRKIAPGAARRAWAGAIKRASPSEIIAAAVAYAKSRVGEDPKYTPHPATWLNGDRWLDKPPEPSASPTVRRVTDGII